MKISFDMALFTKSKLSPSEFLILMYLEQKKFNVRDIDIAINISQKTIFRIVKKLTADGYLERAAIGSYLVTDKLANL